MFPVTLVRLFLILALSVGAASAQELTPPEPDSGFNLGVDIPTPPSEEPFIVGVGDVLQVSVWKEPDVSVPSVTVRTDGKISVPLVREVYVAGLTPLEIEEALTNRFRQYINNPVVTVIVREVHSRRIYIVGGVASLGMYELEPGMTVMHALAVAGGLTEFAKRNKIFVVREIAGQPRQIEFDYMGVLKGKDPGADFELDPGDTIYVPQ